MMEKGDLVIYNGCLPEGIDSDEGSVIRHRLKIGELYEIDRIDTFVDGVWYRVFYKEDKIVWAPEKSFCKTKNSIKERYGLK
jgi:hypothetical protein